MTIGIGQQNAYWVIGSKVKDSKQNPEEYPWQSVKATFIHTHCVLSVRYFLNQDMLDIPIFESGFQYIMINHQ